jgi:hypothetical protein
MNQPPRATPTEPILTTAERRPGRAAAILGILLTILLAGSILAFLFYRSITAPQPNRVIVVRGSSEWHGVDLSVDGGNLKEPQVTGKSWETTSSRSLSGQEYTRCMSKTPELKSIPSNLT